MTDFFWLFIVCMFAVLLLMVDDLLVHSILSRNKKQLKHEQEVKDDSERTV